ncbi:glycosyltransferase [Vibrio maritimus]|uniref:glycosyltransferase n=1 Tax=Vibrio maritimus TaxID=990268 RepID=UPI004068A7D7
MTKKVAVAMSVYKSDSFDNLKLAIDSILQQSYECLDFYIQVDGYIESSCRELLDSYSDLENVFVTFNKENKGLAFRLNTIIDNVVEKGHYKYIARMDADDISFYNRIELQVQFLEDNKNVSVVGSDVIEISDSGKEIFHKRMFYSHDDIAKKIIKKCPFNHPTVMFRESVFSNSLARYKNELKNTQDYYLWVDLLASGHKFANLPNALLYFRVNGDFHSRRGFDKAMNDLRSRVYAFQKLDVLSASNFVHMLLLFLLRISPVKIKEMAYKYLR